MLTLGLQRKVVKDWKNRRGKNDFILTGMLPAFVATEPTEQLSEDLSVSMSHKAFLFDWKEFQQELAPLLASSLKRNDPVELVAFANDYLDELKDPYEGEPIAENWLEQMENGDIQEVADFVLTKYYDPTSDAGLGDLWLQIDGQLEAPVRAALLGEPFGPLQQPFDPGRMGTYFQTPEACEWSLEILRSCNRDEFAEFIGLLERGIRGGSGIYVTF